MMIMMGCDSEQYARTMVELMNKDNTVRKAFSALTINEEVIVVARESTRKEEGIFVSRKKEGKEESVVFFFGERQSQKENGKKESIVVTRATKKESGQV